MDGRSDRSDTGGVGTVGMDTSLQAEKEAEGLERAWQEDMMDEDRSGEDGKYGGLSPRLIQIELRMVIFRIFRRQLRRSDMAR